MQNAFKIRLIRNRMRSSSLAEKKTVLSYDFDKMASL